MLTSNFRFQFFCFCLLFLTNSVLGQSVLWQDIPETNIVAKAADRLVVPNKYRTLHLDFQQLKAALANAPQEQVIFDGGLGMPLDFPFPDGSTVRFRVWEAPVMAPELMAKFPDIHSYAGIGVDKKTLYIRFDVSPAGLHAMVLGNEESSVFIDPYAKGNTKDYTCHFKKDFRDRSLDGFVCHVNESDSLTAPTNGVQDRAGTCGNLRSYRLALACTGEYAAVFGGTVSGAMQAMNTSVNRVSGVYELEMNARLVLVGNNNNLIFTNAATDPYTNDDGGVMLDENVTTCNNIIGAANYDIGHVFSTGGGGIAGLGVVCGGSTQKAWGVTGLSNPVGDNFDIDYVAHEMGHQYGGAHTFYSAKGACSGNQSNTSAMEPGSGSTIMSYAGICGADDIQPHSDAYLHARSLQQMASTGGCSSNTATGNHSPVVTALTSYTIPISTPFVLNGSATDQDGDGLTFCWEQMDPRPSPSGSNPQMPMPPQPTSAQGPLFRSFSPTTDTKRYFPQLSVVWSNSSATWEVLPSVSRTMNFRLTVRDNHGGGGCTAEQNMTVTSSSLAGPFVVNTPNGFESYPGNSTQTVIWSVANTNGSPVNCATVNILFTTDGGATFTTLLSGAPNNGSATVVYPAITTTTARVMVRGANNVFYDVSNNNFTLTTPLPVELLDFTARKAGKNIRLDWSTASERNNRGFQIERSVGNAFDFRPIGWKEGHGTTTEKETYFFEDEDVKAGAVYYYRLQQTDIDARQNTSEVKVVVMEGGAISVVPNPAVSSVKITLPVSIGEAALQASVLNTAGQLLLSATLQNNETLDVANLPDGVYFLRVMVDNTLYQGRFVKE